jgi:hypothetical protein
MVGVCTDRYDTKASGNWYKADEPWGAYLQTDGNPAVTVSPYESDPSSGSFNPQAHTTWVPVDWNSWPNCKSMPRPIPLESHYYLAYLLHCHLACACGRNDEALPNVFAHVPADACSPTQTTSTATASTKQVDRCDDALVVGRRFFYECRPKTCTMGEATGVEL